MTYDEFINNILETRGRFNCGDEYHERHHIVPKCMGGTNDEDNLIDLFAREHFEAHRILALENPENDSLMYAFLCMSFYKGGNTSSRYEITAEEYELARIKLSILQRKNKKGKYFGEDNPNYGNHKLAGENNPMYGKKQPEYVKQIIKEKTTNRLSNPENHPMYGKKHSEKSKRKMSQNRERCEVLCVETGVVYSSMSEAQRLTGTNKSSISDVCRCKYAHNTAGGFTWKYLHDQTQKDGTIIPGAITLGLITEEEALKMLEE